MDEWHYEMRREIQEIIPGLFLGPFSSCRSVEELQQAGITHILCFIDENEQRLFRTQHLSSNFIYQTVAITDSNLQNIIPFFGQTTQWIADALAQNGKVIACCSGGLSRSPTFVIAYIMETFGLEAIQAYHFVQNKRLCINPNDGFKSQLKEYEPIYKARQTNIQPPPPQQRIRRRSFPEEEDDNLADTKRSSRADQDLKMNAAYTSSLL
ncbi:phosphatases II [Backusella circina FSU 941]|nr:phosphatases II [Backusella circina FSU 941]